MFSLGKYFVADDEQHVAASIEYGGGASGAIEEEALAWAPDRNGKFRLQYVLNHWEGSVDVDMPGGPLFWDESTLKTDTKPLIETKFEIRKRMYKHLGPFITALAKDLAVEPFQTKAELDDIPF